MSLEKKDVLELVLTLVAVIAGSIAASGAFVSAGYEQQRVSLEEKPAILLSCEPEFRSLDLAQGIEPETKAAFLDNRGAHWIHVSNLYRDLTPAPFARCMLTNYGRLPLLNLRLAIALQGKKEIAGCTGPGPVRTVRVFANKRRKHDSEFRLCARRHGHAGGYRFGRYRGAFLEPFARYAAATTGGAGDNCTTMTCIASFALRSFIV